MVKVKITQVKDGSHMHFVWVVKEDTVLKEICKHFERTVGFSGECLVNDDAEVDLNNTVDSVAMLDATTLMKTGGRVKFVNIVYKS